MFQHIEIFQEIPLFYKCGLLITSSERKLLISKATHSIDKPK